MNCQENSHNSFYNLRVLLFAEGNICEASILDGATSLPAEVAKRHESVRKQLSVVFPRVCILKEYCQARRWNIQLVHKACFFINIIPSGKHEPQRDGGLRSKTEGECGTFKYAIAIVCAFSLTRLCRERLAAARARSGSDSHLGCHSIPSRRFTTSQKEPLSYSCGKQLTCWGC